MKQKIIKTIAFLLVSLSFTAVKAQTVKDIDGNVYKTVTIGTQTWMTENLKTTNYNDGTAIPFVSNNTAWINRDSVAITTAAYYWYDNDSTYKNVYGALYNGYTIITSKLCPCGWHLPSDAEWSVLTDYLGGEGVAGGKLKERGYSHWVAPNTGATNETGFNALPGGSRFMDGSFKLANEGGNWWSSSDYNSERTWFRGMNNNIEFVIKGPLEKPNGISVRCVRDKN
ncbi:MAG TPA: hypothetical protein DCR40_13525 [Prolixibacteraceae bacterium]|nr:hypothetical protein [Prolixibacteraceae bacterium]